MIAITRHITIVINHIEFRYCGLILLLCKMTKSCEWFDMSEMKVVKYGVDSLIYIHMYICTHDGPASSKNIHSYVRQKRSWSWKIFSWKKKRRSSSATDWEYASATSILTSSCRWQISARFGLASVVQPNLIKSKKSYIAKRPRVYFLLVSSNLQS